MNSRDNDHFPVLHLHDCDAIIAEDMPIDIAYFPQGPTVYLGPRVYRDAAVLQIDGSGFYRDAAHRQRLLYW